MGTVQETCVGNIQSTNKHFLSVQAYPGDNSLITEVKVHSMKVFNEWVQNIEKLRKLGENGILAILCPRDTKSSNGIKGTN